MTVTAYTLYGERITIRNKTISEALAILQDSGVPEDWVFKLEAVEEEMTH
jgi:hypothetical protein